MVAKGNVSDKSPAIQVRDAVRASRQKPPLSPGNQRQHQETASLLKDTRFQRSYVLLTLAQLVMMLLPLSWALKLFSLSVQLVTSSDLERRGSEVLLTEMLTVHRPACVETHFHCPDSRAAVVMEALLEAHQRLPAVELSISLQSLVSWRQFAVVSVSVCMPDCSPTVRHLH